MLRSGHIRPGLHRKVVTKSDRLRAQKKGLAPRKRSRFSGYRRMR